jgi:hypothetical protein
VRYKVIAVVFINGKHALSEIFGIMSELTPDELAQILKQELKASARTCKLAYFACRSFELD